MHLHGRQKSPAMRISGRRIFGRSSGFCRAFVKSRCLRTAHGGGANVNAEGGWTVVSSRGVLLKATRRWCGFCSTREPMSSTKQLCKRYRRIGQQEGKMFLRPESYLAEPSRYQLAPRSQRTAFSRKSLGQSSLAPRLDQHRPWTQSGAWSTSHKHQSLGTQHDEEDWR